MAQSSNSNLWGLKFFWNHSTNEIPHVWAKWGEKFHLTIIAKDSVVIDDIITPERELKHVLIPEQPAENEDATHRLARNTVLLNSYTDELKRLGQENISEFNFKFWDIEKKFKSQFYLPLGKEGQKSFAHKMPGKKILDINFAEFWQLLKTTFASGSSLIYNFLKSGKVSWNPYEMGKKL